MLCPARFWAAHTQRHLEQRKTATRTDTLRTETTGYSVIHGRGFNSDQTALLSLRPCKNPTALATECDLSPHPTKALPAPAQRAPGRAHPAPPVPGTGALHQVLHLLLSSVRPPPPHRPLRGAPSSHTLSKTLPPLATLSPANKSSFSLFVCGHLLPPPKRTCLVQATFLGHV